jgi:hypothetical protein
MGRPSHEKVGAVGGRDYLQLEAIDGVSVYDDVVIATLKSPKMSL